MIHKNIYNFRKKQNMTMEELGKRIGVSKQTISRYENGEISSIPYDKIILLAEALNCNPAELMGWSVPETKNDAVNQANKELEFEDLFSALNESDQEEIIELMKFKISKYRD